MRFIMSVNSCILVTFLTLWEASGTASPGLRYQTYPAGFPTNQQVYQPYSPGYPPAFTPDEEIPRVNLPRQSPTLSGKVENFLPNLLLNFKGNIRSVVVNHVLPIMYSIRTKVQNVPLLRKLADAVIKPIIFFTEKLL